MPGCKGCLFEEIELGKMLRFLGSGREGWLEWILLGPVLVSDNSNLEGCPERFVLGMSLVPTNFWSGWEGRADSDKLVFKDGVWLDI